MRNSGKQDKNGVSKGPTKAERDVVNDDVDGLFRLPLAEFTGARNELAARLKKSGREEEKIEAARVKSLAKPSISAWAVNQLYWNHREAFDRLIASGERFHKAQTSGKVANMREAMDARREVLSELSDLATSLLRDAGSNPGQNPTPDTIHRITTTLEGISAYASRSEAQHSWRPGRLTTDVDPPGFELFGTSIPGAGRTTSTDEAVPSESSSVRRKQKYPAANAGGTTNARRKASADVDARQLAETRKAKMAAARVSLQDAKRSLTEARARSQSLETAQKRADAEAKKAEKQRRDAEESLEKAKAASEAAAQRAQSVAVEVEEAATEVEDASRKVEEASKELEKLFGE